MSHDFTAFMVVTRNDDAEYFRVALLSLLNQSMKPSEILIIDNGGLTEQHYEIIDSVSDEFNLNLMRIENLSSIGYARNIALNAATYPIIAVADPDDVNEFDRFINIINELNDRVRMVGSWMREFSYEVHDRKIIRKVPCAYVDIIRYAKLRSPVNNPTICYFKKDALEVGGYNTSLSFGEDYDLVMKFIRKKKIIFNLQCITVNFRAGDKKRLYQKRSGLFLLTQEIKLHWQFFKRRDISLLYFFMIITLKMFFRLLPRRVFDFFYIKVLRKNE
ncbi:MAG: glycosyltransferase [Candidatus Arsenophonus phytopathogenicus]